MSDLVIEAKGLTKQYGTKHAVSSIDLEIPLGKIVGLIGPNGAGKTTVLKAILGLTAYTGDLTVLGHNPIKHRTQLLENVCFIADTAILPRWISVAQLLEYLDGIHKNFDRQKAEMLLDRTEVKINDKVKQLSKGMITQLHLALIMAIDAKLLILDEPTLGLDIIHRKQFYSSLLGEYYDHNKTIIITTHQVEEIENILTDIIFINKGEIVLNEEMEKVADRYVQVDIESPRIEEARQYKPLSEQAILGGFRLIFEISVGYSYEKLGKVSIPSISDLFVAMLSNKQHKPFAAKAAS